MVWKYTVAKCVKKKKNAMTFENVCESIWDDCDLAKIKWPEKPDGSEECCPFKGA